MNRSTTLSSRWILTPQPGQWKMESGVLTAIFSYPRVLSLPLSSNCISLLFRVIMFSDQFELESSGPSYDMKESNMPYEANVPYPKRTSPQESKSGEQVAPNFYYWRDIFPELQIVYENIDVIAREAETISKVSSDVIITGHNYHLTDYISTVGALARRPFYSEFRC